MNKNTKQLPIHFKDVGVIARDPTERQEARQRIADDQEFFDTIDQIRREVRSTVGAEGGWDIMELLDTAKARYKATVRNRRLERELLTSQLDEARREIESLRWMKPKS